MKKFMFVMFAIFMSMSMFGCSYSDVPAGHEGVVVKSPIFFGNGEVVEKPVTQGKHFHALTTDIVCFTLQPFRQDEKFDDLLTADNTPVDFSSYIVFKKVEGKSADVVNKFGINWYTNNIEQPFRTLCRDLAKEQKLDDLISDPKVTQNMADTIKVEISKLLKEQGLPYECLEAYIGKVMPPKEVIEETSRTAAQKQREKTEDARAKAELNRKQAEENKALADKAYLSTMNMTTNQYLTYRSIEIEKEKLDVVRNKQNVHIIMGSSNAMPTFNVN